MLGFRGSHIHNSFITCPCLWPCFGHGVQFIFGRKNPFREAAVCPTLAQLMAQPLQEGSGEAAFQHSRVACFAWVDILFFNYFRSHVFALSDWIRIFSRIYVRHLHFLFMPVNEIRVLSNKLTFPVSSYIFSLCY